MDFPVWLKGVFAAFIGGSTNIITVVITDPVSYNFDVQWRKTLAGGVLAVAAFLKKSPYSEKKAEVNQS
jgi:hypothetical protein